MKLTMAFMHNGHNKLEILLVAHFRSQITEIVLKSWSICKYYHYEGDLLNKRIFCAINFESQSRIKLSGT